jgi:hypothetical protein
MGRLTLAFLAILVAVACDIAAGSEAGVRTSAVVRSATAEVTSSPADRATTPAPKSRADAQRVAPGPRSAAPQRSKVAAPRTMAVRPGTPFAYVGGVALAHPAERIARVGFHQASDVHNRDMSVAESAARPKVMPTRYRPTPSRSAADILVPPRIEIRAPVTGIVKRAAGYRLYCKHDDNFVTISPVGHPELEVKVLHVAGLRVKPGDRVVAGKTPIARHATKFPFGSQVDAFSEGPAWPHVHMEVTQLEVPDATPVVGQSLTIGNC